MADITPEDNHALRLAARDHRQLAAMRSPIKIALWLAMMRPVEELDRRAESFEEQATGENSEASETRSIPAIIAMGEAMVRKAIRGDVAAFNAISDRIEGKVGFRKGDEDPDDSKHRETTGVVIEAVVRALTDAKLGRVVDAEIVDITPSAPPVDRQDTRADTPRSNGHANGSANGHAEPSIREDFERAQRDKDDDATS